MLGCRVPTSGTTATGKTAIAPLRLLIVLRAQPLVLALLALAIVALRAHTWDEPFETDITGAAVIGQALLDGRLLYSDLWDHKPPALHVTHAAAIWIAGFGPWSIYTIGVTVSVITLLGVHAAAAALVSPTAGLWAAAFWTLLQGDAWLQANQPNAEVYVNACLVWAFALLLRARGDSTAGRFLVIGALVALGSLYKQVIVAPAGALLLGHALQPPEGRSRRQALIDVVLVAAVVGAAWTAVIGYFTIAGRLADFWGAVVDYNGFYVQRFGPMHRIVLEAFGLPRLFAPVLAAVAPAAALAAAGTVLGLLLPPRRGWTLFALLAAATPLAVGLHGQFVAHYYQLWLPTLAVGAGGGVALLGGLARVGRSWAAVIGVAGLVLVAIAQAPVYALPAEDWSVIKYGPLFVEERRVAREIDTLLAPGETFYVWGSELGLHFWTRRPLPSGVSSVWPITLGPQRHALRARLLADLVRERPELVVRAKWTHRIIGQFDVLDWIEANYRTLPDTDPPRAFTLHVRRDGRLDRRLRAHERG